MSSKSSVPRPSRSGRVPQLLVSAFCLVLAAAVFAPQAARAGSYTAGSEAALKTAIQSANADADANATITLTGAFAITTPQTIPAATKPITIDTAGFTLTNAVFNSSGGLTVSGAGEFRFAGTSTLGGELTLTDATLRVDGGAKLTAPSGGTAHINGTADIVVDGAGSVLTSGLIRVGESAGAVSTVTVQNGGALRLNSTSGAFSTVGYGANSNGSLTITGAGSRLEVDGLLGVGSSNVSAAGTLTISSGATATISNYLQMGLLSSPAPTTQPHVQVAGSGSTLVVGSQVRIFKGDVDVLGGAVVTAPSIQMGGANGTSTLLVSGAGSNFTSSGAVTVGNGNGNTSIVTLANGGVLSAGGGLTMATAATRTGVLNIGGTEGGAAAAAGSLSAATLAFGTGTGRLNFNHTGTNYTFSPVISGAGAINQVAGVTHLTGTSAAFTGTTTVSGGALQVDGTLGGATSSVAVSNSGVLGGSGTIGGNVAVTNGGLAPGNSPGTLTIGGNLTLAAASVLDFEFGQSNVAGGPLNDLVKVGGALTLDGTINVAVTAGGVFDAGLYRVIGYGGALTNNGLTVGATPPGSTVTVQTSVAGQVNLVNTAGFTVNFWDGDGGGSSGNNALDGGAGTWTAATTNWTIQTGAVNAAYVPDSFVVFAAAPGLVTVNNTAGAVRVGGAQFAVDGYSVGGGPLTLTGATATIRVGDGTADGVNSTATLNAVLSGTAKLVKTDLGALVLTANNTYTGGTQVSAGRLYVNGTQAAGVAANTVGASGTLGGTGRLGGDLTVDGILAPGGPAGPGTLTIDGDVVLNGGAQLNYRLGQAGTVGGALNDRLAVNGDLTLDGTLNVTQSAGGTFGPGIYRLIDYTGALTDQGLALGTLAGTGTNAIQTSVAGQVNLVNTAPAGGGGGGGGGDDPPAPPPPPPPPPPTFNFWDAADGAANGTVSGGDGVWRAGALNWTTATGGQEGAFSDGNFAIFAAAPGKVTVDGADGVIDVSGLQFASGGYRLDGDAVGLDAGEAVVRVGDGTSAGAAFVATIDAELTGLGQLHKTDGGTLVLTGANSYVGGTVIDGGTLQLGEGGKTGSIAGDVIDNGVLAFDRSDSWQFAGVISGGGSVLQIGPGVTTLAADSSAFAGRTQVRGGTLSVTGALGGAVEVLSGARLIGTGLVGGLANQGIVAPGLGVGTLSVAGAYAGQGGVLEMEAELGGDASRADRLVVRGATSGTTLVDLKRLGGAGAVTSGGILLVQVDGASDGAFALAAGDVRLAGENALIAGAYAYVLRKDGGGDWRLRSSLTDPTGQPAGATPVTLYQPGAPVYEAYPQVLQALNGLGAMRQRLGARRWAGEEGAGVWGRLEGGHTRLEPTVTTTGADLSIDRWKLQFGIDLPLAQDVAGGRLAGGLTAHYGEASVKVASAFGGGDVDTKGYGVGATLTWAVDGGAYLDLQAQASWFDSDLSSRLLGERANGADGKGYAGSVEAGWSIAAGPFSLTPQAQLAYAKADFDRFVDSFGAAVSLDEADSLVGRLGLALDRAWASADTGGAGRVYGVVNLRHEFGDGSRVDVSGAGLVSRAERTWGGLTAGGTYSWAGGRFTVYGEASADTSLSGFGDSYDVTGSVGVRLRF